MKNAISCSPSPNESSSSMEKVSTPHRRQAYTRMHKFTVLAVAALCYAWFAWQLYVSPWYMAAFAVMVPALGWMAGFVRQRRTTTVLLEIEELA